MTPREVTLPILSVSRRRLTMWLWCMAALAPYPGFAETCENVTPGSKQLLWGDLHVHTAWSLDAYAFGAAATPADAFAFARGQPLRLANGETARIDRPLDFAAVTDHAETFDVMYACTDPLYREDNYCRQMRKTQAQRKGRQLFTDYLLPIVAAGQAPAVCQSDGFDCEAARATQWRRVQEIANAHNEPCSFSALIGYEWSASPGGRHWHRNVIFRSSKVPPQAFDYLRYPQVESLWAALDANCQLDEGCAALAIPHNINWADGGGFEIEAATAAQLQQRSRYERVAEIHQEKGNSECLPEAEAASSDDCNFEILTANFARSHVGGPSDESPEAVWRRTRSTYYRSLLTRGLVVLERSELARNPLMLGAIGSTDNHLGTPGKVAEDDYWGSMSMLWSDDAERLANAGYNPGGLVAVWAEENTRAAVFDALQRREAYATSGPRISLRFGAAGKNVCESDTFALDTPMGGLAGSPFDPRFAVMAARDSTGLVAVDIVKGEVRAGEVRETVHRVAQFDTPRDTVCLEWQDPDFDPAAPAYWYARVLQAPTPRWTRHLCSRMDECNEVADATISERAWSSPVWFEPR